MFKHVDEDDSSKWDVIDLITGKRISGVQWADDETGNYEIVLFNEDGSIKTCVCNICGDCHILTERKKGKIKLIKNDSQN